MKGTSGHLEMQSPLRGEMRSMQIGLGVALSSAAAEASGTSPSAEASLARRRRRLSVMACLAAVSLTFLVGVASLRSPRPTTDEWASTWPLRSEILSAVEAARAGELLAPIVVSEGVRVVDGGVPFVVLKADASRKAEATAPTTRESPRTDAKPPSDPFSSETIAADENAGLVVRASVFGAYALVLNKFPALEHHALLITKEFAPQDWRLTKRDLDALHRCATAADALGFYNSDAVAGASQPHRHFQLVFNDAFGAALPGGAPATRDGAAAAAPPVQVAVDELPRESWRWSGRAPFVPVVRRLAPFRGLAHGLVQLPDRATFRLDFASDAGFDDALLRAYFHLLHDLDLLEQPPYNLLISKNWMLIVKRSRRDGNGIDINALGYAGCLLARDDAHYAALQEPGAPLAALRAAATAGAPGL